MKNPFENPEGTFYALKNDKGQYSLWPAFLDIPDGWDIEYGKANREDCIYYIETHWIDIRIDSTSNKAIGLGK
ncbi:MbtH family protein [Gracilibacillus caseinilyticus]|uniref:MbtH family protein n=1 Tax=Gracilibacillus caseinilyticus TaxID=2932256 RepID=A0ABY4EW76_9BACI|nr:MbtH family protein [Gracilibacillus caseinilyticus]UOQ48666.1 MbtH family protein [Gracilibacillus caseinilyticus]